jgi:hypothetical protein
MRHQNAKAHDVATNTFGAVLPGLSIECVRDLSRPSSLSLHSFDGRKYKTSEVIHYGGRTRTPPSTVSGLAYSVRFPPVSKAFESGAKLCVSMQNFLSNYSALSADVNALVVAFAFSSWFTDCTPVAPLLYLLGPENETSQLLRLLDCLCRRPILLSDVDLTALRTLPNNLNPTLLCSQRDLSPSVTRVLWASNNRYFHVARGKNELHTYGAKAFSANPDLDNDIGVRASLSPAQNSVRNMIDEDKEKFADNFQAKLLRYRFVNYKRVRDSRPDAEEFVPAMRDHLHTWLAPLCDCPNLQQLVRSSLLQLNRENASNRLIDARSLVAEAALFYCHKKDAGFFLIGELAECVNALLKGRHEDRELTAKKVGLVLRSLGICGERVVEGYKVMLSENVRAQIHGIARAYQVPPAFDGVKRCSHCLLAK